MTSQNPSHLIRKRCFDPIVDDNTRLLVLGSLPSEKSLVVQQYYGNKQNQFWRLMSEVIGIELVPIDYRSRLRALLAHGVGLWDVVADAYRKGSLDGDIKARNDNDLLGLLSQYPNIKAIAFNGGTAGRLGVKILGDQASSYQIIELPSSSPALTLPFAQKAGHWLKLRPFVGAI